MTRVYRTVGGGTCFIDYDHDADLDLFVANGHAYPQIDTLQRGEETYSQPNQLFENREDGSFGEVMGVAVLEQRRVSRGSCMGDYDNDGDLDLLVFNLDERPTLLRNDGAAGNWLLVRLMGQGSTGRPVLPIDSTAWRRAARLRWWRGGAPQPLTLTAFRST